MTKVQTLLTSVATWLIVAGSVAAIFVDELTEVLGADHPVVTVLGTVGVVLATAISVVRRVTPVLKPDRGLS